MSSPRPVRFFCGHCGAVVSDPDEHHCSQTPLEPLERQVNELRATVLEKLEAIEEKVTILLERRNT